MFVLMGLARLLIGLLALVSCGGAESEAPTPYAPYGELGGYSDQNLGGNRWLVSFRGNAYTSVETATAYVYRRASEVCDGDFDVISEESHDNREFWTRWPGARTQEGYAKPRRQLVVTCKRKPSATREPTAVHPSPSSASPPVVIGSDVDAGGYAPLRDAPF
jgi:hypothetical protein